MEDILHKIKQERALQLKQEEKSFQRPSFKDALKKEGLQIIGEIKRASPSKGQIATDNFDLLKQANHYASNNIAAFSILTEEAYFKGDNTFIEIVAKEYSHIPILRKDFIYTPFQVAHSKFLGASAILLIVRMLNNDELNYLHQLAQSLGMDVLVEVHNQQELSRALAIPNLEILGINNRNLNTFEVSLQTTENLIALIPKEKREKLLIVSESGYLSKEDIEYAKSLNVDALLIGEALMKGLLF
jgi:indole-3-glycerol phosphate synthase